MTKFLLNDNYELGSEKRNNSRDFIEEQKYLDKNLHKSIIHNESKQEYDIVEEEVEHIEKLTNSKILGNIGYGGFSIVKLIFSFQQKSYFAMKVVKLKFKLSHLGQSQKQKIQEKDTKQKQRIYKPGDHSKL